MIAEITSDLSALLLSVIAGFLVGLAFFWTLWLTVQRLPKSSNPGMLLFGSYLLRTAVAIGIFYVIMDGRWQRMVALIIGFIIARFVMVRREGKIT
ncbi:MAG TPA: ATP synthase subunit I [Levilinea sp.]|nr:ATP synthase subunit I [Levilinea sp.]